MKVWHIDITGMEHHFMSSIDDGRISKGALSLYTICFSLADVASILPTGRLLVA